MRVKFKVITPIHIGSGEELNRFDYVLYEDGIGIIDKVNFNDRVKKDKKVFNDFLKASENLKDLVDFLEDEVLDEEVLTIIETNEKILEILERNYSRAINSFIKDKFLKKPIIPGSSVKGAIRTAILDYVVFYNKNLQRINNTFFS